MQKLANEKTILNDTVLEEGAFEEIQNNDESNTSSSTTSTSSKHEDNEDSNKQRVGAKKIHKLVEAIFG